MKGFFAKLDPDFATDTFKHTPLHGWQTVAFYWTFFDIKFKNSMKKKIAKKRAGAQGNMRNIGRNKSRNMFQNAYFLCLQGIRMRRSTKETE